MDQTTDQQTSSKAEQKRLRKEEAHRSYKRGALIRWVLLALIPVVFVGWIAYKIMTSPVRPEGDLVSRKEVHWHAKLDITVRGQAIVIPANIGIPVGQPTAHPQNMHTHAEDHIIHIEKFAPVYTDDLRISHFFETWGKQFNSQCVVDDCVKDGEKIIMKVNGQETTEFENFPLHDKDVVEITLQ